MAASPVGLRAALVGALALALALAAWGWVRVLARDGWATGARRVSWTGPDGAPLPADGGLSCTGDIKLTSLVVGEALWTTCTATGPLPGGGLAFVEPAAERARAAWPLPDELDLHWTVGALPHAHRPWLAWLFRAGPPARHGLAAAVAGPDGWVVPPTMLAEGDDASPLGMAWVGERLELALVPTTPDAPYARRTDPLLVALTPGQAPARRAVPRALLCGDGATCRPLAAVRGPDGRWRFLVFTWRTGDSQAVWRVAEDGRDREPVAAGPVWHESGIDRLAVGLIEHEDAIEGGILDAAGGLTPRPARPPGDGYAPGSQLRWDGTRLQRDDVRIDTALPAQLRRVGDRTLVLRWEDREAEDDELLTAAVVPPGAAGAPGTVPGQVVARTFSFSCGGLYLGTLVPRAAGGHWLATPDGCYVALDAELRRADPLEIGPHLLRRGSVGLGWHEPSHVVFLAWLLFGLPLALGGTALAARLRRRRGARPAAWLLAGTLVWLAPAAWFALRLTEVLR